VPYAYLADYLGLDNSCAIFEYRLLLAFHREVTSNYRVQPNPLLLPRRSRSQKPVAINIFHLEDNKKFYLFENSVTAAKTSLYVPQRHRFPER
jgi:hypothetical protein